MILDSSDRCTFSCVVSQQRNNKDMKKPPANPLPPRWVTTEQVSDYFQVSTRTIANWRDRGLPHRRINARVIRYTLEDCEKFANGKN